jgi:hypothetical protein
LRVWPRNGADQQTGQRGVGGVVGAKAGRRRVGRRSDIIEYRLITATAVYRRQSKTLRPPNFQHGKTYD